MIFSNQQAIAEHEDLLTGTVMTLRIITFAMMAGLLMFLVVVTMVIGPLQAPKQANPAVPADKAMPVLTVASIAAAAILLPLSVAIPGIVGDAQRRKLASTKESSSDVPALIQIYQTKLIMAAALTEGPGFFAIIVFMLEGNPIALALALLIVFFLALRFPIHTRVVQWLDGQLDRLQNERRNASIA